MKYVPYAKRISFWSVHSGSLHILCVMFWTHCIRPVYVRAFPPQRDASLASRSICGLRCRGYTQNHVSWHLSARKRRKRGDAVVLWMYVSASQAVLAMYNLQYHRGAPGGGDAGLQPPPPTSPQFEISKTHLVYPMTSNIVSDLLFSRNQLMSSPLEFWKVKLKIFGYRWS
jgi:hypothetical protein